ncbi:MAG: ATP-binding protein [Thermodesulfobacteriota bacterium]
MRKQIIIALGLIIVCFLAGSGLSILHLSRTTGELRSLISLHEIEDIRQDLNLNVQRVLAYVHASPDEFSSNLNEIVQKIFSLSRAVNRCQTCHHQPDVQRELDEALENSKKFEERLSYMITTVGAGPWRQRNQQKADELGNIVLDQVQDMVNRAAMTIQHRTTQAMANIARSNLFILLTLAASLVCALFLSHYLTRSVTAPIDELLHSARELTAGNLGYQSTYKASAAEFNELIASFNEMSRAISVKDEENTRLTSSLQQKIKELERTQKQLVEAEKLTALGTLAGGIAHDFNNILCGIISNISLLKRGENTESPRYSILDTVEKAGFRAADLVQQLLTFARQDIASVQRVNLNQQVNNVLKLIQPSLARTTQTTLDLQKDLPIFHGDPARIEQVIMNLAINARDAMPEGGKLTFRTRGVHLDEGFVADHPEATVGDYVTLDVADTGCGIENVVLNRIFEPFFTTKPFGKGTGLGLAMVHGIVKSHEGFVMVDSKVGEGSRFSVFLPINSSLSANAGRSGIIAPEMMI